jgi:cation:H+ antiporter
MIGHIGWYVLATVLLVLGADSLTRGVAGLALRSGMGGYAVGLAATAFGAIVPVLAVTLAAVCADQPSLALGGLVGGSIAQLSLVLGLAALAAPLRARLRLFRLVNPALILATILVLALALDARFGSIDGVVFVVAWLIVAFLVVRESRAENGAVRDELAAATGTAMVVWRDAARVVVGGIVLPFAAVWLVEAVTALGGGWSISPLVAGLILLGLATALASVPPSVTAARNAQGDYAIGHAFGAVFGSILLIAGGLALWQTLGVARSLQQIELPALAALAVALYPMMRSDGELSRREGVILVVAYALFLALEIVLACCTG